jgi:hypothetical protein
MSKPHGLVKIFSIFWVVMSCVRFTAGIFLQLIPSPDRAATVPTFSFPLFSSRLSRDGLPTHVVSIRLSIYVVLKVKIQMEGRHLIKKLETQLATFYFISYPLYRLKFNVLVSM